MAVAELLILDAGVLIDYVHSELRPLALWAKHVGPVHVPRMLLREVDGLSEKHCLRLGLQLVDPSLEQLGEVAENQPGLSFEDRLCLVLARDGLRARPTIAGCKTSATVKVSASFGASRS